MLDDQAYAEYQKRITAVNVEISAIDIFLSEEKEAFKKIFAATKDNPFNGGSVSVLLTQELNDAKNHLMEQQKNSVEEKIINLGYMFYYLWSAEQIVLNFNNHTRGKENDDS